MPTLLAQGIELMVIGMSTVFLFLTLLVFATKGMSAVVQKLTPAVPDSTPQATSTDVSPAEVAAISIALDAHRRNKR